MGTPEFNITEETGRMILEWCNSGSKNMESPKENNLDVGSIIKSETYSKKNLPKINPHEAFECNKEISHNPSQNLKDTTEKEVYEAIQNCNSVQELYALYKAFPQFQISLKGDYEAKKSLLLYLGNPNNFSQNGKSRIQ